MVATTDHDSSSVLRAILAHHKRHSQLLVLSTLGPPVISMRTNLRFRAPSIVFRVQSWHASRIVYYGGAQIARLRWRACRGAVRGDRAYVVNFAELRESRERDVGSERFDYAAQ